MQQQKLAEILAKAHATIDDRRRVPCPLCKAGWRDPRVCWNCGGAGFMRFKRRGWRASTRRRCRVCSGSGACGMCGCTARRLLAVFLVVAALAFGNISADVTCDAKVKCNRHDVVAQLVGSYYDDCGNPVAIYAHEWGVSSHEFHRDCD